MQGRHQEVLLHLPIKLLVLFVIICFNCCTVLANQSFNKTKIQRDEDDVFVHY